MRDKSFVPFYKKQDGQRLQRRTAPVPFPNYLNRHMDLTNDSARSLEHERRTSNHSLNPYEDPARESRLYSGDPSQDKRKEATRPDSEQKLYTTARNSKEERYARIRRELAEYQEAQRRRPFRPSEVPSIWQSDKEKEESQNSAKRSAPAKAQKKPAAPSKKSQPAKKGHLNRGLDAIMKEEAGQKHSPFFKSQDPEEVPYLKKHGRNGEHKGNE